MFLISKFLSSLKLGVLGGVVIFYLFTLGLDMCHRLRLRGEGKGKDTNLYEFNNIYLVIPSLTNIT